MIDRRASDELDHRDNLFYSGFNMYRNYRAVIDMWPTYASLASELDVTPDAVKQMRRRDRIPARHWLALIRSAQRNGYPEVTLEQLAKLAESSYY